ncbi:MAG: FAD-dependent oxidoreductase [Spirochaetota bacterium]
MKIDDTRDLPVLAEVDVLVAGGGLGGIAAATASARAGAKTMLIERNSYAGGVATAGLCCSIFNCYYTADHRLAVTGIPVEIADTLAAAEGYGKKWHDHKGHIIYDVESAKRIFDRMLTDAGVAVQFGTMISGVVKRGDTLAGLIVESASGREVILAKTVIDATGETEVAHRAGAPLKTKPPWARHSLCFRFGNADIDAFVTYLEKHPGEYPEYMDVDWTFAEALAHYRDTRTFLFPHGGFMQLSVVQKAVAAGTFTRTAGVHDTLDACQMHGIAERSTMHVVTGLTDLPRGVNAHDISHAIMDGRTMAAIVADFFNKNIPGFERAFISQTADNLGIRATRWLDGDFVFTKAMRTQRTACDDRIARGAVQLDVKKHAGKDAWGVQTFTNDMFDIPYRALIPRTVDGLIIGAGRSISAEDPFLLRVMAHTMAIGQAAGTAGAVAAKSGRSVRTVDVAVVQSELVRQGVSL